MRGQFVSSNVALQSACTNYDEEWKEAIVALSKSRKKDAMMFDFVFISVSYYTYVYCTLHGSGEYTKTRCTSRATPRVSIPSRCIVIYFL